MSKGASHREGCLVTDRCGAQRRLSCTITVSYNVEYVEWEAQWQLTCTLPGIFYGTQKDTETKKGMYSGSVKGGIAHSIIFPRGVVHRVENGWGLTKVAAVLLNGLIM